jgi:hypothetical protein
MSYRFARRTCGIVPVDRQKEMSGLKFVQGLADGMLPRHTIARTLSYDVTGWRAGVSWLRRHPSDIHLNPAGTVRMALCSIP